MEQFDDVAEIYDDNLKDLLGVEDTEKFAEYKIQLAKYVSKNKKNGRILDFGCGTGRSYSFLKKYFPNCDIYGCDVSKESLLLAENYFGKDNLFVNDSVEKLSCKGKFDIVIAACVFHHIPPEERQEWINGVIENLTDEGMFFIFEHNVINPMTKKIVLDDKNLVDDINWMLSHKLIKDYVEHTNNGKIVWDGYTLFSPWRPSFMTRLEMIMKWCPLGAQHCVVISRKKG